MILSPAQFLAEAGVKRGMHVLFHGSYRLVRSATGISMPEAFLEALAGMTGSRGSVILPAFSYCFRRRNGGSKAFSRAATPAETGAFSESFRRMQGTIRTLSPTHSFCMQGRVAEIISAENNPESPLGEGSIADWISREPEGFVLLAGCGFESLSFLHYAECFYKVPYLAHHPWGYMGVTAEGFGEGAQPLKEVPGCSRSFNKFYTYLMDCEGLMPSDINGTSVLLVNAGWLLRAARDFFTHRYTELLCPAGDCMPCGSRRNYLQLLNEGGQHV